MFRFHPLFWLGVALFFLFRMQRRHMRRRWAMSGPMSGPMGYAPFGWGHWGDPRDSRTTQHAQMVVTPQPLAQPDRTLVESLESRIAELETRLEFTERLMANRKEQQ